MSNMDILQVSARLEADKRLSTLFDIMRDYGDTPAALWLKEDKEFSRSYKEITRRADDLAAYLTEHTPKGGWIAIAVDTCHYWPTLFWGVIPAAGRFRIRRPDPGPAGGGRLQSHHLPQTPGPHRRYPPDRLQSRGGSSPYHRV